MMNTQTEKKNLKNDKQKNTQKNEHRKELINKQMKE